MSIDFGGILDTASPIVESAIDSIGSEWTILRNPRGSQDKVTDRTTGKVSDPAPEETVAAGVLGIWAPDTGAGAQAPAGPNLPGSTETGTMICHADLVDVQERDVFACTASRDLRLIGRRFVVDKVPDGSAGVLRLVRCGAE